jgi:hypothetical protein
MYAWVFARFTERKHGGLITYFQINRDYRGAFYGVKKQCKIIPMRERMCK